ncbi:hypothetical protein Vau01_105370 [Virgisporangium aurantiacum]|uniref:HTH marR-type domain-containing protein n=1 Tax=Virgisporangium aurantiacum TaxID=175570 RepID=A0A8J3ZK74_9ACTN|nr:hypothetical protein Vau01_105370 [Virgisporangium aurantiacum]
MEPASRGPRSGGRAARGRRDRLRGRRLRAHAVELTDAGRKLFHDAEKEAIRVNDQLLAHLSAKEQEQLRHLLRRFTTPDD